MGENVYERRGDSTADGGGIADTRAVRARKLPADGGVRRSERNGEAHDGGKREPERILSCGDACGCWAWVLAGCWVLWALAGLIVSPGLLRGAHVICDRVHRLGFPSYPGPVADVRR